ncbi:hypothetical protein RNI52_16625 [Labrys neptuniae]|uniref:hypothetical protein n=1 Tax=Labrys TaxID=204476 RepID=UPI00288E24B7|nr:hypothetical protein [Labrys neptuniae]MDT3378959.1 hypothetical protein [Labrys neptuniae]
MNGRTAGRAWAPGIAILVLAAGLGGCNTPGLAGKPIVAAPPKPEPTMDQAREIAMSGIASIGEGYRVTLDADGSGRAWRDGVPGVVPVAWSVLDSSKTTLDRPSAPGQPAAAPAIDPATGQPLPQQGTGKPVICVELPRTLNIATGYYKCAFARDWKTQPRTSPAGAAPAATTPTAAPAANAG